MEISSYEEQIMVSWGQITVKIWGNLTNPYMKIICLHGISDNAGTFDLLIPKLPQNYTYICVDLPGHGKSSAFKEHFAIHVTDNLIVPTLIANHFKLEQFILMGHSMGGVLSCCYTQMYPEKVKKLILLDVLSFRLHPAKEFGDYLKKTVEGYLKLYQQRPKSFNSIKEGVEDMVKKRKAYPINEQAAEPLVRRMLKQNSDGKYVSQLDPRIAIMMEPIIDIEYITKSLIIYPIQCPLLIVFSTKSQIYSNYKKSIDLLEKQPNVEVYYVEGHHNIHSEQSSIVGNYISNFLIPDCKL